MPVKTARRAPVSSLKASVRRIAGKQRAHVNFFKIGALELERWRKEKERELALGIIAAADERLAEIHREIAGLLQGTNLDSPATRERVSTTVCADSARRGFNIKY